VKNSILISYPAISARGIDLDIPGVGEEGPIAIALHLQGSQHPMPLATPAQH
jgi:hypothetical protein